MFGKSQTALLKYKANREGTTVEYQEHYEKAARPKIDIPVPVANIEPSNLQWVRVAGLVAILAVVAFFAIPHSPKPIQLTYEVDLTHAEAGTLIITLIANGKLPDHLDLAFPPGVFGDKGNGVTPHAPTAHELDETGLQIRPLAIKRNVEGWRLSTRGTSRAGFVYQVDLTDIIAAESDVRRHISKPVAGGLRAAGFEIFLQPLGVAVDDVAVHVYNPDQIQIIVPWPALVRNGQQQQVVTGAQRVAQAANLSGNRSYRPARRRGKPEVKDAAPHTVPVPANMLFHPRDLADLNNSLIICGNIATASTQARDCVIQLATDRQWHFTVADALDLVRRIARTEMGFFGSSPTPQITVLLSSNEISDEGGFDTYGVHTGSSVLVMMDQETTLGELEEHVTSVIAHEMFHGWLGEAIPQQDLDMLWFTEGATTWYAARMLNLAGIWTPDHAQAVLRARLARDYTASPHFGNMSVAIAAKGIMADADQVRFGYAGGMNAVMALDRFLAEELGEPKPLDGVLRELYRQRDGSPLTRAMLVDLILRMTGVDCDPWLDEHVFNKTTLPAVDSVL